MRYAVLIFNMATCNQRYRIEAQRKKDNARTRVLEQRPHARGWVNRVTIVTPRKPNSAKRPVIKVFLRRGGRLTAHIPGIGHTLKKFGKILVRGRGPRDLPGVRYSGVRGVLDFIGLKKKKRRRSIYGAEQNNMLKVRARRKYRVAIRKAERERVKKINDDLLLEQESTIVQSTQLYLKLQKQKNIRINININSNLFFFKNPVFKIESRTIDSFQDSVLYVYSTYLNFTNAFLVYSFFFVFMFCSNYGYTFFKNKLPIFFATTFFFYKPTYSLSTGGIVYKNKLLNVFLGIFYYSEVKFKLLSDEQYKYKQNVFFIPLKRQLRQIAVKKQFFFFLINTLNPKKKQFFLKNVISYSQMYIKHYKDLQNLNFFFFKNRKRFFKKLLTCVVKSNTHFMFTGVDTHLEQLTFLDKIKINHIIFTKKNNTNIFLKKKQNVIYKNKLRFL